ncbi:MAG: hypothetical protein ACO37F_15135, partial [Pirellulales bacterium]
MLHRLAKNEVIAAAALLGLAVWGVLSTVGLGGIELELGSLDPAVAIGNPPLTPADVPLVSMLVLGGIPLVSGLL